MLIKRKLNSSARPDNSKAMARSPTGVQRLLQAAGSRHKLAAVQKIGQPMGVAASTAARPSKAAATGLEGVPRPRSLGSASIGGAASGRPGATSQRSDE